MDTSIWPPTDTSTWPLTGGRGVRHGSRRNAKPRPRPSGNMATTAGWKLRLGQHQVGLTTRALRSTIGWLKRSLLTFGDQPFEQRDDLLLSGGGGVELAAHLDEAVVDAGERVDNSGEAGVNATA